MFLYHFPSRKTFYAALHILQNKQGLDVRFSNEAWLSFKDEQGEETCLENEGEKMRVLEYQSLLSEHWAN